MPYARAWRWQRRLLARRTAAAEPPAAAGGPAAQHRDVLLVLEHAPCYTLGRSARPEDVLADLSATVHRVDRGGRVTFHGPGQVVLYPLLHLRARRAGGGEARATGATVSNGATVSTGATSATGATGATGGAAAGGGERGERDDPFAPDLHQYVRNIEEVAVRALRGHGLGSARRAQGLPGVWVGGADEAAPADPDRGARKIASVGMGCSKWFTTHGLAVNVAPDLGAFARIAPCGVRGEGVMTSLARERGLGGGGGSGGGGGGGGGANDVASVKRALLAAFADVFRCELRSAAPGACPLADEGIDGEGEEEEEM